MIDMNAYEQQKGKVKKAKRGKVLLWIGLIITCAAVILLIIGIMSNPIYAVVGITAVVFGLQMKRQNKSIDVGIMTVKCKNCGYLERVGAEFCSKCGKPMQ